MAASTSVERGAMYVCPTCHGIGLVTQQTHDEMLAAHPEEYVDVDAVAALLEGEDPAGMAKARAWASDEGRRLLDAAINNGWQTIESAPKDGTRMFQITEKGALLSDVYWIHSGYMPVKEFPGGLQKIPGTWSNYRLSDPATHWHPSTQPRERNEHS